MCYTFTVAAVVKLISFNVCLFKQKTAYVMRISDWSSDVCSSDLVDPPTPTVPDLPDPRSGASFAAHASDVYMFGGRSTAKECSFADTSSIDQAIGRAPCRERGCKYV